MGRECYALPLNDMGFKTGLTDILGCYCCDRGLEKTTEYAFFHCPPFGGHADAPK